MLNYRHLFVLLACKNFEYKSFCASLLQTECFHLNMSQLKNGQFWL